MGTPISDIFSHMSLVDGQAEQEEVPQERSEDVSRDCPIGWQVNPPSNFIRNERAGTKVMAPASSILGVEG